MLKGFLRRKVKPWLVRYRRFMQAELMHEVLANRNGDNGGDNGALARSMEAALLTIALHHDEP